jgi:hypothetical protein
VKPRKVYEINDPALLALIAKRPRYVNVLVTCRGERNWARIYRPRVIPDHIFGFPEIHGRVMVNPRYCGVMTA